MDICLLLNQGITIKQISVKFATQLDLGQRLFESWYNASKAASKNSFKMFMEPSPRLSLLNSMLSDNSGRQFACVTSA